MTGRSLPHADADDDSRAVERDTTRCREREAFYEYHSSLMEPWDGPASIAFTDGSVSAPCSIATACGPRGTTSPPTTSCHGVGGRGARHPAENIVLKERLHPGKIFLVDTAQGRIVADAEIKRELAAERPYRRLAR